VPSLSASTSPQRLMSAESPAPHLAARAPGSVSLRLGLVLVGMVLLMAVTADWLTSYSYAEIVTLRTEVPPTSPDSRHILGTDALGRDLFTRLVHGARVSLEVGLGGELVAVLLGVALGGLAGWRGGWVDSACMRLVEVVLAFPVPLVVLAVVAAIPDAEMLPLIGRLPHPGISLIAIMLGLVGWAPIARLVRAQVMTARTTPYSEAARALGARDSRILCRHLLPNCISPVLVAATLGIAGNILAEAWLSFLGLGARPPLPSWGSMILQGQGQMMIHPLVCVAPGLMLALTVLGFNLLGDGLRDRLDPRLSSGRQTGGETS
jgi:ABC-type dipeptide/oligopeptide/nickel transport system permease subunit